MARKIIGAVKPFCLMQEFYVYEDGNKIDTISLKTNNIDKEILPFVEKYNVSEINLIGSKQFNRGLSKKIKAAEMAKFNKNELIINI